MNATAKKNKQSDHIRKNAAHKYRNADACLCAKAVKEYFTVDLCQTNIKENS